MSFFPILKNNKSDLKLFIDVNNNDKEKTLNNKVKDNKVKKFNKNDETFNFILPLNNDMDIKKPENIFSFFLNGTTDTKLHEDNKIKLKEKEDYRKKILDGEPITIKLNSLDDLILLGQSQKMNEDKIYNIDIISLKKMVPYLIKLNELIGLTEIKEKIFYQLLFYLQGLDITNKDMLHTVISGPPGVGKTELAKILSEIYSCLGILSKGTFNIAKRSDLIGSYLGSTATKTNKILENSKGGVLFIDEAYSLGNSEGKDIYSKECIDTINQFLSENRSDFICIIAGYKDSLEKCFFNYNSGLQRRFTWKYDLKPYTYNEMKLIFDKIVKDNNWRSNVNDEFFKKNHKEFKYFGGDLETLFHKTKLAHGLRSLNLKKEDKRNINIDDINKGFELFVSEQKKQEVDYFMYT